MKVIIPKKVRQTIQAYVDNYHQEISGVGYVKVVNGNAVITKVLLPKQKCTPTSTDLDEDDLGTLLGMSIMPDNIQYGELKFWWHSHVDMGVFWSGTDNDTMKKFGKHGWIVASVFNKKKEVRSAYMQGGVEGLPSIFVDNVDTVTPEDTLSKEEIDAIKKEIDEKVQKPVFTSLYTGMNNSMVYRDEPQHWGSLRSGGKQMGSSNARMVGQTSAPHKGKPYYISFEEREYIRAELLSQGKPITEKNINKYYKSVIGYAHKENKHGLFKDESLATTR
jgi:hypothetical protein